MASTRWMRPACSGWRRAASSNAVAAIHLKVVEVLADRGGVEILQVELGRRRAGGVEDVGEEQAEGVAICGDRVRAGASLTHQPVGKERLQGRRERTHSVSCPEAGSSLWAASASN